ncbi:MAG: ThuA domain-containing protein [Candidatus Solibacter sp.]
MFRVLLVAAGIVGVVQPQDWAQIRTAAEKTAGFKVTIPLASFRPAPLLDVIGGLRPLNIPNLEAVGGQNIGGETGKALSPDLSPAEIATLKAALGRAGVKLTAITAPRMDPDEATVRKFFQFAKELGVETILCSSAPGALPLLDRLASEFQVNVAVSDNGNPQALSRVLEGRGERLGAGVDLGQWLQAGLRPMDGLTLLRDRLMAVRLADRDTLGPAGKPVRLGSGTAGLGEFLLALYRQKTKPAIFSFEAAAAGDPLAALSENLAAYETLLTPVMTEYVNQLGRTSPIRTLEAQSRLTPEQKSKAQEQLDAALPAHAQAVPKKPRRLLVIDLQVGYSGHPSIPYANYVLEQFGRKTGAWNATFSNDLANFRYEQLRQYDAIFLNNTVGLLFPDPAARAAIVRFLREGGGLIGYHASTHASIDWPEFTEIIGASSGGHREATEKVTVKLEDPASAINRSFDDAEFVSVDEHFRWTNFSRQRVHVLLSIDVPKTDMNQGRGCSICTRADNDYPISWIRNYGKGRVFYTSLGHGPGAFLDSKILGHILAGVQFALGDLEADATPGSR